MANQMRTEIETASVTLKQGDGTLGKVLSTAGADKKKIFTTTAVRAILLVAALITWRGNAVFMIAGTVILGALSLSPLRFLGDKIEFCEYGVRHNQKEYLLPQQLSATWRKIEVFSIFWVLVYLDLGTQYRLNISYIKDCKKAFLLAYQPNTVV